MTTRFENDSRDKYEREQRRIKRESPIDHAYVSKNLKIILRDIKLYDAEELHRALTTIAKSQYY